MCSWREGYLLFGGEVVCAASRWAIIAAAALMGLVALVVVVWALRRAKGAIERAGATMFILAALLLAIAAGLPLLQPVANAPPGGRIAVIIDASESVRRTGDVALTAARSRVGEHLRALAEDLPEDADWRGSVWAFGDVPRQVAPDVALGDLDASVIGAELGPLQANSNLETAVAAALREIAQGPGAGQIILVTDALQTQGNVLAAVNAARQSGVAINIFSTGSTSPAEGLLSHDIGPDQAVGRPAVVRATVQGGGRLVWGINGAPETDQPEVSAPVPTGVRISVQFAERGLNFVSVGFAVPGQAQRPEQAFTLVRGPARILVYGNAPWVDLADPAAFLIERAAPRDAVELGGFDAIVIDTLSPVDFARDMPQQLLDAAAGGTGLFIVNGPLRGSVEDMQRLSDWEATVLGPVLPVNSDPAEYLAAPPKRDILIIIDTSGSMAGNNMRVAREAANRIIDSVRSQDSLTIVPFSSMAGTPFVATSAGPDAIAAARRFVRALDVAGETNMNAAVARARQLRGNNCALFIIGDGGYEESQIQGRPICYTTAIGVQNAELPGIDTSWGQQIPIRSSSQLGAITFKVFEPEPRTTFWAEGNFDVEPADDVSPFEFAATVAGIALSYPRPESTDVSVITDPPRAPALAFRQDPIVRTLRTGVFLGVVPSGMPAGPEGWASAVLSELVGWDDPDLFDIDFRLNGEDVELRITALGDGPTPPTLGASIVLPDGRSAGISLKPPNRFGIYEGTGRISLSNSPTRGILLLEMGNGEMQSIPLRLPERVQARSAVVSASESFGFGVDQILLDEILVSTGGVDLSRDRLVLTRSEAVARPLLIWPWLAGLAIMFFSVSLFFGGVRR